MEYSRSEVAAVTSWMNSDTSVVAVAAAVARNYKDPVLVELLQADYIHQLAFADHLECLPGHMQAERDWDMEPVGWHW